MCTIITASNGHVLGTHNFATGKFVPAQRNDTGRRLTDDEAMSMAMWIQNHSGSDEAEQFLEDWLDGKTFSVH